MFVIMFVFIILFCLFLYYELYIIFVLNFILLWHVVISTMCTQGAQSHKCILLFMSHTLGNILNETGFYKQLQALQIAFD
jgi:hypothetical protein